MNTFQEYRITENVEERDDWMYENETEFHYVEQPKYLCFTPNKKRICVEHYVTVSELRFRSDKELDMYRKRLYDEGKYELEEGEIV